LHSLTPHDNSLTIIQSPNQSSINQSTLLIHLLFYLPYRYELLGEGGPVPLGSAGSVATLETAKIDPAELVFGKLRHYQVHRDGGKSVEGAEGGNPDLGHVILRLLPSSRGNVIAGLDEGVRHMSLGETANVKVRFDHAYNSFAMTEYIPARANMVFTVQLQSINGFGLAGLPLLYAKRLYRFITFACRTTSDFIRLVYRDAKKKKRVRRLCSFLYSFIKPTHKEEEDGGDREAEEYVFNDEDESDDEDEDEAEARPLTIKADASMRKHLTPAVHAGAKYFWNYTPKVRAAKKKKNKKKKEEEEEKEHSGSESESDGSYSGSSEEDDLEDIEEGSWEEKSARGMLEGGDDEGQKDDGGRVDNAGAAAAAVDNDANDAGAAPSESMYSQNSSRQQQQQQQQQASSRTTGGPAPPARSGKRPPPPK
jgi:hypothetical protein